MTVLAAPLESAEADKFEAAFHRKGRTGLGFSSSPSSFTPNSTTSSHLHLSSSSSLSSSFSASRYLERFGWRAGVGLGKKEDGKESFVRVSKKADNAGIGAGLAAQAVARSFENLFNSAARSINIVVESSEEEEEEDEEERKREKKKRKKEKKDKERKKRERQTEHQAISSSSSDENKSSPSPSPSPPLSLHLAFKRSTQLLSDSTPLHSSSPPTFAADVASHDEHRAPLYHDRCRGKLARIRAQEEKGIEIVEMVRRRRWDGMEEGEGKAGAEDGPEEDVKKEKKRKRERRAGEMETAEEVERVSPQQEQADDERQRRKREKKESRKLKQGSE